MKYILKISKIALILAFATAFLPFDKIYAQSARDKKQFEPFFRIDETSPKFMPPPPKLTDFDKGILKICGNWGAYPAKRDFRALLDAPQHQKIIQTIYNALDHQVFTPNANLKLFKDELAKVWFISTDKRPHKEESDGTGFRHIFCGEPTKRTLGGMHFVGRYLEAQEKSWAGAIWNQERLCNKQEIKSPVYTLGVQFLNDRGKVKVKCPSGYSYTAHADDILVSATKAFKGLGGDGMCLYNVNDDYQAVFIRKKGGILTFYPDLSPKCDRGRLNCDCNKK